MSEPVTVSIKLSDLENLLDSAKICAEDLACEIANTYPQESREKYPSYQRKYENDMAQVKRLNACISMVKIQIT